MCIEQSLQLDANSGMSRGAATACSLAAQAPGKVGQDRGKALEGRQRRLRVPVAPPGLSQRSRQNQGFRFASPLATCCRPCRGSNACFSAEPDNRTPFGQNRAISKRASEAQIALWVHVLQRISSLALRVRMRGRAHPIEILRSLRHASNHALRGLGACQPMRKGDIQDSSGDSVSSSFVFRSTTSRIVR
jgi:hypothetical protein